jgi:hypothetical protein
MPRFGDQPKAPTTRLGKPNIDTKNLTAQKLGNVGNVGNVTRFPRVFRCFSLESNIANVCQAGNVTSAGRGEVITQSTQISAVEGAQATQFLASLEHLRENVASCFLER